MRASKGSGKSEEHVSGAECIEPDLPEARRSAGHYYMRAMAHPRGEPDEIVITLERLKFEPRTIEAPPVTTLQTASPKEAIDAAQGILRTAGVSARAMAAAKRVLGAKRTMRGAALISAQSGQRLEPDRRRGIRATLVGISHGAGSRLRRRLARMGINTPTVREALVLASKILACPGVLGELCVSDDPDYTTGYVCTHAGGYVRLTNIKPAGNARGGRTIFLDEDANPETARRWLEDEPTLVTELADKKTRSIKYRPGKPRTIKPRRSVR